MIPLQYKPFGFDTPDKESWDAYRRRLAIGQDAAVREFYRQVVYDHFDHFNENYPGFILEDYQLSIRSLTAAQAVEQIRSFENIDIRRWCFQFDEFERTNRDYLIFQEMYKTGTAPFPPVLVNPKRLQPGSVPYGQPLHLIEGAHRVSYLIRMLERELIDRQSVHEFAVLEPIE